jgi:hypothetical protein
MMLMLRHVGDELRVYKSAERDQPERKPSNGPLSNAIVHRSLSKSRCLDRLLFLNPCDGFLDLLLGQQAAFNVFLHTPLLVDEDAHG